MTFVQFRFLSHQISDRLRTNFNRLGGLSSHSFTLLSAFLIASPVLLGCGSNSERSTLPSPTDSRGDTPTAAGIEPAQEVNVGTGTALVWGTGRYGVVLVHGAIYDAGSWTDEAQAIADEGFAVVAVENAIADDTQGAIDYLRQTFDVAGVALIGASAGTGPVLTLASDQSDDGRPLVDLVIILAGSGNVDDLKAPSVLFISAEGDTGSAAAAKRMMNATSGNSSDLLIVSGNAHAQAIFDTPEGAEVLSAIITRLEEREAVIVGEQ